MLTGSVVGALVAPLLAQSAQQFSGGLALDPLLLTWLVASLILVPALFLILAVQPDTKEIAMDLSRYYPGLEEGPKPSAAAAGKVGFFSVFRDFPKLAAIVTTTALHTSMIAMMAMTSLVLNDHVHNLPAISLSLGIHIAGMFAFSIPLGRLADKVGRRRVLLLGLLLTASGCFIVPLASAYWLATTGILLVGIG